MRWPRRAGASPSAISATALRVTAPAMRKPSPPPSSIISPMMALTVSGLPTSLFDREPRDQDARVLVVRRADPQPSIWQCSSYIYAVLLPYDRPRLKGGACKLLISLANPCFRRERGAADRPTRAGRAFSARPAVRGSLARYASAFLTRSAVNGAWRKRVPVSWAIALPIAGV